MHTVYQIGQGIYIVYYVTGTGWDKTTNEFKNQSSPVYMGEYWEYKERATPQGLEMTSHRVVIPAPDNPEEDQPEMAEKMIFHRRTVQAGDIDEVRRFLEEER